MKTVSKISVIIPVYNVEKYLRQCLDSIVNQTYRDLEIIIIDDGSPDKCGEICDEYAARDKRIKLVHQENKGLSAARNEGIRRATGKWLTFVDSDDWLETDYFQKMIPLLEKAQPDVLCAGGVYMEEKRGTVIGRFFCEKCIWNGTDDRIFLIIKILTGRIGKRKNRKERFVRSAAAWDKICCTSFIKGRELYFDEKDQACEDLWYSLNVVSHARTIIGCDYIGYHYRFVESSITKGYNLEKPKILYVFCDKLEKVYGEIQNENIRNALNAYEINMLMSGLKCSCLHPSFSRPYSQIVNKINEIKTWPHFYHAIYSRGYQFLSFNQAFCKILLKLPSAWPFVIIYQIKQILNKGLTWFYEIRKRQ